MTRRHLIALSAAALASAAFAQDVPLARMDFDHGSSDGLYATGAARTRLVKDGANGSAGALEIHHRGEDWNSAEFGLSGRLPEGGRCRFAASVRQDAIAEGTFQLSLKIEDAKGIRYEAVTRKTATRGEWARLEGECAFGKNIRAVHPFIEFCDTTESYFVDDVVFTALDVSARDTAPETELRALKEAFHAAGLSCGASVGDAVLGDPSGRQKRLLTKHFDSLSPENQLKAQFLLDHAASVADLKTHQRDAALDFSAPKVWFDFAKANGMRVSAQALVWFLQTPEWFFHVDYDTSRPLASREVMLARVDNYIRRVLGWCEREYPGVVRSWVVVNEAVDGDAEPHVRDDLFFRTIGEDYVARAFEFAAKYRPKNDCLFLYNDANLEGYPEKTKFVLDYLKRHGLIERKLVDGIGLQCHLKMDWPDVPDVKRTLSLVAASGLKAEITEFDLWLDCDQIAKYPSEQKAFEAQGARVGEVFKAVLEARKDGLDIRNVTWWGLTDAYSWLTNFYGKRNYPLLFDSDNHHKPAFDAVVRTL